MQECRKRQECGTRQEEINTDDDQSSDEINSDEINSEDETEFTMQPIRNALLDMFDELTAAVDSMKKVSKEIHQPQDLYESLHIHSLLHKYLPKWKEEQRMDATGLFIRLNDKEASFFDIFTEDECKVSVYELCYRMAHKCIEK